MSARLNLAHRLAAAARAAGRHSEARAIAFMVRGCTPQDVLGMLARDTDGETTAERFQEHLREYAFFIR